MENKTLDCIEAKEIFNRLMNKVIAFSTLAKQRAERDLTPFMKEDVDKKLQELITSYLEIIDNFCTQSLFDVFFKIQEPQLREQLEEAIQEQKNKELCSHN